MTRIFVYGSLMRGECNHARMMATAKFAGRARTLPRFTLFSLGSFPAMVEGGDTAIAGELYDVDATLLARLDVFEGHPNFYRRARVDLAESGDAEAYIFPTTLPHDLDLVTSGDWRTHPRR